MGYITDVQLNRQKKRASIYIDHSFSFSLDREIAVWAHLHIGDELFPDKIEELKHSDCVQGCLNAALRFLEYRPRSEAEVRQRLRGRSFDEETVNEVIARLKRQSLIDDRAFANYWKENRLSFRPKSKQLIKLELLQKGVSQEIATDVIDDVNDEENACKIAQKKARIFAGSDYDEFRNYMSNFLRRKGYGYDIINYVVARIWQEQQNT